MAPGRRTAETTKFRKVHAEQYRFPTGVDGKLWHKFPEWAKKRIDEYDFFVEQIEVKSVRDLAEIYERYNSSGRSLDDTQVRLALFHWDSALHHGLLAMAGGPYETISPSVLNSWGISLEDIAAVASFAEEIRNKLPKANVLQKEERIQVTKATEKIYDFLANQ